MKMTARQRAPLHLCHDSLAAMVVAVTVVAMFSLPGLALAFERSTFGPRNLWHSPALHFSSGRSRASVSPLSSPQRRTWRTKIVVEKKALHLQGRNWCYHEGKRIRSDQRLDLTLLSSLHHEGDMAGMPPNTPATTTTTTTSATNTIATLWKMRGELFQMTRPNNIPGVILFHMLGVYLAVQGHASSTTTNNSRSIYWSLLLRQPLVWLSLFAVLLVSASSMVVNDYYDAKLGRDTPNSNDPNKLLLWTTSTSVNDEGDGSSNMVAVNVDRTKQQAVRLFLMYLYSTALLVSNVLPGIPTRLSVTVGLMMTYLYTVHLKPMTWVKNIVCASLIALAPWTSGSCALYVLQQTTSSATTTMTMGNVWLLPSLWRLFGVLMCGVMGREILMDCTDVEADAASDIRTVPVVFGSRFAVQMALLATVGMTALATLPHVHALRSTSLPLLRSVTSLRVSSIVAGLTSLWKVAPWRRLMLASVGCALQLVGTLRVLLLLQQQQKDTGLSNDNTDSTTSITNTAIQRVIDHSLWTVVLLLASFV